MTLKKNERNKSRELTRDAERYERKVHLFPLHPLNSDANAINPARRITM